MNSAPDTTVSKERSGSNGDSNHAAPSPRPVKTGAYRRDARAFCFARSPPMTGRIASSMKISRSFGRRSICCCLCRSEFGGAGMTLAEVCREQRRLAYHAPATALAVNMHLYWLGVAADLWRRGDASLEWILREAAAGEIFAAGHAESGNDIPVLLSTTKAERVEGGYRFTGHEALSAV